MKALVTGYKGFVGRHLWPMLEAAGYDIVGTEHFVTWMQHDFSMLQDAGIFDVVVHLGANIVNVDERMHMGMRAYDDMLLDHVVCSWLERHPPKKCFVVMSSCAVDYPQDPYCIVKRNLEAFATTLYDKGVPVVILRPFSGYGPDQSPEYPFRAIFERALRREDPLTVWGGSQVRDWLWVDDLCAGIMAAIDSFPRGGTYELGTAVGTSLLELTVKIAAAVGYHPALNCDSSKPSSSPRRVARRCGVGSYVLETPPLWMPGTDLDSGIRRSVDYYRSVGRL